MAIPGISLINEKERSSQFASSAVTLYKYGLPVDALITGVLVILGATFARSRKKF